MRRVRSSASTRTPIFEPLEDRRLYSATPGADCGPAAGGFGGASAASLQFSLTPAAVQIGLETLAATDNLTAPAATDKVQLGNSSGVETYSVTITSTGTVSTLTVDATGTAVTQPTHTTTTYADLQTSDAAAATGLSAIVTADGETALASTDTIDVTTAADGTVTYSLRPAAAPDTTSTSTSSSIDATPKFGGVISVNGAGVAVGDQTVAFSVLPTAIQNGLNAGAPTGATALTSSSTQDVRVQTIDGVVLYSTKFTVTGTDTMTTVNIAGAAASLPTTTTADFSTIPTAAQTELQSLATAEGSTDTIATTASVSVYTEASGVVLYSLQVSVPDATTTSSSTTTSTTTSTHDVTLTVDASGNPTVLPAGGFGGGVDAGGHGPGHPDKNSSPGGSSADSGDSSSTGDGSSTGTTTAAASKKAARKAKAAAAKATRLAAAAAKKAAKLAKLAAKREAALS